MNSKKYSLSVSLRFILFTADINSLDSVFKSVECSSSSLSSSISFETKEFLIFFLYLKIKNYI